MIMREKYILYVKILFYAPTKILTTQHYSGVKKSRVHQACFLHTTHMGILKVTGLTTNEVCFQAFEKRK